MNEAESRLELLSYILNHFKSSDGKQFYLELSTNSDLWPKQEMKEVLEFADQHAILTVTHERLNIINGSELSNDDRYLIKKGVVFDSFFSDSDRELSFIYRNGIMTLLIDGNRVGTISFQIESTDFYNELLSNPNKRLNSKYFNDKKSAIAHYNNHKLYSKVLRHFFVEANRNEVMITNRTNINAKQHYELLLSLPIQ